MSRAKRPVLDTFIDPARFRGTGDRAAHGVVLGRTTGRGHHAASHRPTPPVKEVLGDPLPPQLRERRIRGE